MAQLTYDMTFEDMQTLFNFISKVLACQFGLADRKVVLRRELLNDVVSNLKESFLKEYEEFRDYGYTITIGLTKIVILETACKLLPYHEHLSYCKSPAFCKDDKQLFVIKIPNMIDYSNETLFDAITWIFGVLLLQYSQNGKLLTYPKTVENIICFRDTGVLARVFAECTGLMNSDWINEESPIARKITYHLVEEGIVTSNGSYCSLNLSTQEKQKKFLQIYKEYTSRPYIA